MGYFATGLGALAFLLVLSGIDDLIPLLICLNGLRKRRSRPQPAAVENQERLERSLAVFVPCWHESAVIGNMIRHNLAVIRYRNFDFFLGAYPNDEATVSIAAQLASEFPNVHLAQCPHPGPTSKADCLNWIYRGMEDIESRRGARFDTVVLHDAEDLIHPEAFTVINRERDNAEMVQIPVLPLKTGVEEITHGVYCDEFSEYQAIDMRARQMSRSFVPSNGVGTGFAREVLERLAEEGHGRVFDPASLTEDYEIGVHIHAMGYRQVFAPLSRGTHDLIATREYFPHTMRAAIRQRTRWITGIALQCWERHGWQGSWRTRYWFWRDRKGLLTNPLSVLANLIFIAGVLDYLACLPSHRPWSFTVQSPLVARLCATTLTFQCCRMLLRALCIGWLFGWANALTVPLRVFHANLINCSAVFCAVYTYFGARYRKRTLTWLKTEHAYPHRDSLQSHQRELADVLIGCGYVSEEQMAAARASVEGGATLDLLLLANKLVDEDQLCRAISLQSGLASTKLEGTQLASQVLRSLPVRLERQYGVVPFAVKAGTLLVATASAPSPAAVSEVREAAELPVEFQLVTQSTYQKLRELL